MTSFLSRVSNTLRTSLQGVSRRYATQASASEKPRRLVPDGYDQAVNESLEHKLETKDRWKWITMISTFPVLAFAYIQLSAEHEHHDLPPDYPYMKVSARSPRYPWGDREFIGTPHDREVWKEEDSGASQ